MIKKRDPLVYDHITIAEKRPEIVFSSQFSIYVSDEMSNSFVIESYVGVRMKISGRNNTPYFEKLRLCRPDDFDALFFQRNSIRKTLCLERLNASVKGYWDESELTVIYIYLERCNNKTSDVVCKSDEEIDEFLLDKYFGFVMPNNIVDLREIDNPVRKTWKTHFKKLDPGIKKSMNIFVKSVELLDDQEFFFDHKRQQSTFSFDFSEFDFTVKNRTQIIAEMFIYSSPNIQKKLRIYQKIPELLARMGGIANALSLIGFILTAGQVFVEMRAIFAKNLYNLKLNSRKEKNGGKYQEDDKKNQKEKEGLACVNSNIKEHRQNLSIEHFKKGALNDLKSVASIEFKEPPVFKPNRNRPLTNDLHNQAHETNFIDHENDLVIFMDEDQSNHINIVNEVLQESHNNNNNDNNNNNNNVAQETELPLRSANDINCKFEVLPTAFQQASESCPRKNISKLSDKKISDPKKSKEDDIHHEVSFGIWDFLKLYFSRLFKRKLKHRERMLQKIENKFLEEFSIFNIITRIQNLEKMKVILLSPEQIELLDLLEKPIIHFDEYEEEELDKGRNWNEIPPEIKMSMLMSQSKLPNFSRRGSQLIAKNKARDYMEKMKNDQMSKIDERLLTFFIDKYEN